MRIRRYIQGHRKGREANRIEREAMRDPFLAEALEGYDRVKGDHSFHIRELRHQMTARNRRRLNVFKYGSIAASLLFLLGFGFYFLQQYEKHTDVMAEMEMMEEKPSLPPETEPIENAIAQNRQQAEEDEAIPPPSLRQREKSLPEKPAPAEIIAITEDSMEEAQMDLQVDQVQMEAEVADVQVAVAAAPAAGSQHVDSNIVMEPQALSAKKQADSLHELPYIKISPDSVMPLTGQKSYKEYLLKKLSAKKEYKDIDGILEITFKVTNKGKPTDIYVRKSLGTSIDKEVIRLIKKGSDWTPTDEEVILSISFQ